MSFFVNLGALTGARAVQAGGQLLALPILARTLSVEDFALAALGMTAPVFAGALSDAGLGRSLVRATRYDPDEWSSVFWVLAGVGLLLTAVVAAAAPLFAWLYDEPDLVAVMLALGVLPLLQSLTAVPTAEMERRDRFVSLAQVMVVAHVVSIGGAVILALAGAGVWALVAQQLAVALVRLAGTAARSRFRPGLVLRRRLLEGHLRFGRDTVGFSLIATALSQAPVMLLGRLSGAGAVGLWAMNERFMRLPRVGLAAPFGRIAYVRMAANARSPEAIAELYLASTRLLSLALFPSLLLLAACGDAAFPLLLSDKWAAVATVFALAAPGVALEAATNGGAGVFMAVGRTGLQLRAAVERLGLLLAALAVAVPFGVEATALAYSLWVFAYLPRYWTLIGRCAPLTLRACLQATAPAMLSGAAFALLHRGVVTPMELPALAETALAGLGGLAAAGLAAGLSRGALRRDLGALRRRPAAA